MRSKPSLAFTAAFAILTRRCVSPRLAIVAMLLVGSACGGAVAPKPSETPETKAGESSAGASFKPPGECIDALADGDRRDATKPFDKHVQLDVRSDDLDGDGEVDIFVKPAWHCGDSCNRSVYILRGTCGHYVGTFPSTDRYELVDSKSNGLRDISTRPQRQGDDGMTHCFNEIWKFDGTEYRKTKQRECECKESGGKCTAWGEAE